MSERHDSNAPDRTLRQFSGVADDSELRSRKHKGSWLKRLVGTIVVVLLGWIGIKQNHDKNIPFQMSMNYPDGGSSVSGSWGRPRLDCEAALDTAFEIHARHAEELATKVYRNGAAPPKVEKKYHQLFVDISGQCLQFMRENTRSEEGRYLTFAWVWDVVHGP
jgi:hypothetical protein